MELKLEFGVICSVEPLGLVTDREAELQKDDRYRARGRRQDIWNLVSRI